MRSGSTPEHARPSKVAVLALLWFTVATGVAPAAQRATATARPPASSQPTSRPAISGKTPILLYVAQWTRQSSPIFVVKVDPVTGRFLNMTNVLPAKDPIEPWCRSFVFHPEKPVLYMTSGVVSKRTVRRTQDVGRSEEELSSASAFGIDTKTGKLAWMNTRVHEGAPASFISIDEGGSQLYVGNRARVIEDRRGMLNSVNVFPIDGDTCTIKPASEHLKLFEFITYAFPGQRVRREQTVPEWQEFAGWRYMVFPGAGGPLRIEEAGADAVFPGLGGGGDAYLRRHEEERERRRDEERDRDLDETRDAEAAKKALQVHRIVLPRDTGASWIAFHPGGKHFYVRAAYEPVLRVYAIDSDDTEKADLIEEHVLERPERRLPRYGVKRGANSGSWSSVPGEVHVHPNGEFLYAANRDHGLAIFAICKKSGRLKFVGRGPEEFQACKSFTIDPSGQILAATSIVTQEDDPSDPYDERNIGAFASFLIDPKTGLITLADQSPSDFRTLFLRFTPDYAEASAAREAPRTRPPPTRRAR